MIICGRKGFECSANTPEGLKERIRKTHREKKAISEVRLFSGGGYFISDDNGSQWCSVGIHCGKELKRSTPIDIAVAGALGYLFTLITLWQAQVFPKTYEGS